MVDGLFTFVQMEFPWALGPADGRYLLRRRDRLSEGQPEYVVVLSTVGADRRGLLGRRRTRTRPADDDCTSVPVARATVVDPVTVSAERQARAWLRELDAELEAERAIQVLNRVLFAHRIATAQPHLHEITSQQALVIRAGYGEGEQVAEGLWSEARELLLAQRARRRRTAVLRPQERLAALLTGRGQALLCEELTLRARADFDAGRLTHAAIELERAYMAALGPLAPDGNGGRAREPRGELTDERHGDLERRVKELRGLQPGLQQAASAALENSFEGQAEEAAVRHGLERLEAALRARAAAAVL